MNAGTLRGVRVPVALLLHELPDGSSHYDLLVAATDAPVGDDDRVVPTWRSAERPDSVFSGAIVAIERIADHRGLYLRLSAVRELSEERGRVTPLRRGSADVRADAGCLDIRVTWDDGIASAWRIERSGERAWLLTSA